jgi:hypothetical protein
MTKCIITEKAMWGRGEIWRGTNYWDVIRAADSSEVVVLANREGSDEGDE